MEFIKLKILEGLFHLKPRLKEFDSALDSEEVDLPAFRKLCFAGM
jgi:hypothetical protein